MSEIHVEEAVAIHFSNGWQVGYEPIVRCRDCIGLVETWDGWECERFSGEYHRAEPNGFCSWAERRTDE